MRHAGRSTIFCLNLPTARKISSVASLLQEQELFSDVKNVSKNDCFAFDADRQSWIANKSRDVWLFHIVAGNVVNRFIAIEKDAKLIFDNEEEHPLKL